MIQVKIMRINKTMQYLVLLVGSASILVAGCSTLEVGIETLPTSTQIHPFETTDTAEPVIMEPTVTAQ